MADSDLERTESATPRRISQAREKGQVARSRELTTLAMLLASGIVFLVWGGKMANGLMTLLRSGLVLDRAVAFTPAAMQERLYEAAFGTLVTFLPFLGAMALTAALTPMALSGWLFTFEPLVPKFEKLNPLTGIARLFSVTSLVEMLKAVAKTVLIGGVEVWAILHFRDAMFGLATEPVESGTRHAAEIILWVFLYVSASLLLVVAIDVPFQLWDHAKKLKMTKEEVKQEFKESEGDPHVKGRIRQMQREMARKRMMAEVPKADVIVTNPTHYAVALKYDAAIMRAPQVVAKGSHLLAERIMELGREHHVPVLRTPPLARALYRHAELGTEIPAALYTAVAEVLAYIYQLKRFEKGNGIKPRPLSELPVPAELDPQKDEA